ncbi:MAG TPA: hypothetical protein VJ732_20395 [Bryobacteraceae bacterium]|nr:hypothetical protein [Bryobacteraceae bacterium]
MRPQAERGLKTRLRSESQPQGERGFALLFVLLLASLIAITMYMELPRVAFETQRDREQLLVDRGQEYQRAIQLFVRANKRYPSKIEDLESFNDKRYLRHRFIDPLTMKDDWRMIHVAPNGMLTDSLVPKNNLNKNPLGGQDQNKDQQANANPLGSPDPNTDPNNPGAAPVNFARVQRPSDAMAHQLPPMGSTGAPPADGTDPNQNPPASYPQPGQPYPGQPYPPQPGQPYPGQPYPGQPGQPVPGQPYPVGQPYPGQPGQPVQPGQPYPVQPGQPYPQPGQPYPVGQPYPGQPGQPYPVQPGQPYPVQPGQPYPQPVPGQPYPVAQPGQPYPQQPAAYPGQPIPGMPVPGQPNPAIIQSNPNFPAQPNSGAVNPGLAAVNSAIFGASPTRSAFSNPGQQGGLGTGIAGVGVPGAIKGEGIMTVKERSKYREWEFVYDPKEDKTIVGAAAAAQNAAAGAGGAPGAPTPAPSTPSTPPPTAPTWH